MVDVSILDDVKQPICTSPIVRENFLAIEYSVFQAYEKDLTPVLCNYYIPLNASIVKRLYSIKEKEYVYSVADVEDRRFSEIWTRKEAYIKRDDRNISLSSFRIDTFKDAIDRQIKTFCIGEYIISVCGNQTVEKIDLTNQEKFHYNVVDMQTSM